MSQQHDPEQIEKCIKPFCMSVQHSSLRVLYLPNERSFEAGDQQAGGRSAFQSMYNEGTFDELFIYSFLARFNELDRNSAKAHAELLSIVKQFRPDIIFWSHPDYYPVTGDLLKALRNQSVPHLLVYHEGDPFDRYFKRLQSCQKILYTFSDVFFTSALGGGRELFEKIRPHQEMFYAPSYTERERFAVQAVEPGRTRLLVDAVMIGNIHRRLGVFGHPGSKERIHLARGLRSLFGSRFKCYGSGWPSDIHSEGPIEHLQQRHVIQEAGMSLMWEHFPDSSFYFSDRLPIALAAGIPFITSARSGYATLFADAPGLFLAGNIREALDMAIYLRSLPLEKINYLGDAARRWVIENLEAQVVFRRMMDICIQQQRKYVHLAPSADGSNRFASLAHSRNL